MLIKKRKIPVKDLILTGMLPGPIKKLIYKLKGYKIGKGVSIGFGTVIIGKEVVIKDNCSIGHFTVIRANEIKIERFVKIGSMTFIDTEKIFIDEDSRINEQVIIGGIKNPDSYIKIGKRTIIMEYSFINPTKPIEIGDDTGIGGHCLLFTHGSWLSQLDGYPVTFAPITLGKNVWLPWRVFIMPGVTVGDNVVIGANSLVTKSFPSNCLIAGSPAKIITDNYPPVITEDKRDSYIENIFNDFINHLKHYDYKVTKEQKDSGLILKINKSGSNSLIEYVKSDSSIQASKQIDSLLIVDSQVSQEDFGFDKSLMVINLRNKKRIGTSNVGEEFVSYISRYGIRFDRLD